MPKINVVKPVRAVTIEHFFIYGDGTRCSCGIKTYKIAKAAARAWASNVSAHFNAARQRSGLQARDGYHINIVGAGLAAPQITVTSGQWPIYERAYRRSLPIFQKMLP